MVVLVLALEPGRTAAAAAPAAPAVVEPARRARPPTQRQDALEALWDHRPRLAPGGVPLLGMRLVEDQPELRVRLRSGARLSLRGGRTVSVAAGDVLRFRVRRTSPAVLAHRPLLAEARYAERRVIEAAHQSWRERGVEVRQRVIGGVYGIAGHVVDNRRVLLVAQGDGSERSALEFAERELARGGGRVGVFRELVKRPRGGVEVFDRRGRRLGTADALATLDGKGGAAFVLERVEQDGGRAAHGFEDRPYQGRLHVTLDVRGRLAAVLVATLEELLRGIVPSEIPAGAPREALKAQAVTARSNLLAQLGTRHLTDPYLLCSEVHCQAYRGEAAHTPATDAAVRSTAGEALFARDDHQLVDAVYSAMCGGHGEDNDAVWAEPPSRNLRGRPDLPDAEGSRWAGGLADDARLRAFLGPDEPGAWCGRASRAPRGRYRWERRLRPNELDALASGLRIGHVVGLEVVSRGVSGRARSLRLAGEAGTSRVEGELRIRQLLGNLPSSMFVIEREADSIVLRGGGWGHGSGMCQWGAVARAEAGQDHREILRAYYGAVEVERTY
jgi:SpoIID/LytB domain protein